jgi:SHS2 domain-containing protein
MEKFRYIDHTGDLGMEVFGGDLPALFQHAAEGFFDIITDPATIREREERKIFVRAEGREELLIQWLEEFVFLFDTESLLFKSFRILSLEEGELHAVGMGEPYKPERHPIKTVVKGATYHQLRIHRMDHTWKAQIIFDL